MSENTEAERLAQLRKKKDESDAAFIERLKLTNDEFTLWKTVTNGGSIYGGPAFKRFVAE